MTQKDVEERLEGEELPPQITERMTVDEGRIYVKIYERAPDGVGCYYDIFDAEGRFIVKKRDTST